MRISDWSSDVCSSDLGGAELVGEVEDDLEVLLRADAAAAGNHALGALQVGAVGLARGKAHVAGVRGQGCLDAGSLYRCAATRRRLRPGRSAHGGDDDVFGRRLDGDDGVAGVDRPLEGMAALELGRESCRERVCQYV